MLTHLTKISTWLVATSHTNNAIVGMSMKVTDSYMCIHLNICKRSWNIKHFIRSVA